MAIVFEKTRMLTDKPFHYCPGCTHGIIHRLVAEALDAVPVKYDPDLADILEADRLAREEVLAAR